MATIQSAQPGIKTIPRVAGRPASSVRFDMIAAALNVWFIIGLFIDGWAHNHGRVDDTFFTPWHAVLYSSVLAVAGFLTYSQTRNMLKGHSWSQSLPDGYGWSLGGAGLFFAAGGFDFFWHELFGFEASLGALLSPAHFALATGAFLFVTGPLRSAWRRTQPLTGWAQLFPAILTLTVLLSLLTFFTMYMNGYAVIRNLTSTRIPAEDELVQIMAIAGILFQTAATVGLILLAMRTWRLPAGAITFILVANAALMLWVRWGWIDDVIWVMASAPLAGIIGDVLLAALRPSAERTTQVRLFAFALPLALFGVYMAILVPVYQTWWTVHMWSGVVFMAAITGLFISYLVFPYSDRRPTSA
jgi:hypothetical protein